MLDWEAIGASNWVSCRDYKMAEFLILNRFPWELVRGIGVNSEKIGARAMKTFADATHRPPVKVKQEWYY
jgi:hypothetical protein